MLLLIDDDDDDDDTGRVLTTLENMEISEEFVNFGKLREFKIYSGNLSNAVFLWRNLCIIVSNSSVNWLCDTVTGVDGASHHAPSIKYSVILQESCQTDCYGVNVNHQFI